MPELPEVETVRRLIVPLVEGRTIAWVATTGPGYFFLTPPATLRAALPGRTIRSVARRGKYLALRLDDDSRLLIHLGMSGQLLAVRSTPASPADRHVHLRVGIAERDLELRVRDPRQFGKVLWIPAGEGTQRLERLGVDALELSAKDLRELTSGRRRSVKSVLLDQRAIAGIGNIYADEALHRSGIRPGRRASRLTGADCSRLAAAVREVLESSIERGGSSIRDWTHPDGEGGEYRQEHRVYGRGGEPCLTCGETVRRVVHHGRATHYCPRCQR